MLDTEIKTQLKEVYANLEHEITLVYQQSTHEKQAELLALLNDLAETTDKIKVKSAGSSKEYPSFTLEKNGKPTNIIFSGIPGGHEFTSLVLAILNAGGKGKMPDEGLAQRIKNIKGPIRIRTYISLTCENCPDVVQAFNQMALIHPDFEHEMIDGAFVQEDVEKLGIQGVPSVFVDSKLIHSGRIDFLDLLQKIEEVFGKNEASGQITNKDLGEFDVVVVGGGPAGASAAIYSARKGFKTALLAERIGGQVKDTKGIENLISVIYTEGPQLAEQLHKHLAAYPIEIFEQRRVKKITKEKEILLESGETLRGKSVIITSGAKWRELGVPGEKEYIGRGVAYCPHCDGPFYKGKNIIVIGGGNSGVEAAIDLAGIAGKVTLLEYGDALKADKVLVDKLHSFKNTKVITHAKTSALIGDGKKIIALEYLDRKTDKIEQVGVDGVFIQIGLVPNSSFVKDTVELSKYGEIIVDGKGHTNIPGIYAAGDVTTTPFKQIIIAMGEGAKVALAVFEDRMLS